MADRRPLTGAAQNFFSQFNAGQTRQRNIELQEQQRQDIFDAAELKRQQELDDREDLALSIESAIGIDTGARPEGERRGAGRVAGFVFRNATQRQAFSQAVAQNPSVSAPILNFLSKSNDFQIQEEANRTGRKLRGAIHLQDQLKKGQLQFQKGITQLIESGIYDQSEVKDLAGLSSELNPDLVSLKLEKLVLDNTPIKIVLDEEVEKRKELRGEQRKVSEEARAIPKAPESRTINIGGGREQLQEFNIQTRQFENVGAPFEKGAKGPVELTQDIQITQAKSQIELKNAVALKKKELDLKEQTPSARQRAELDDLRIQDIKNKRILSAEKKQLQLDARQIQVELINNRVDKAIALTDKFLASGVFAGMASFAFPSNAREMQALIDTIQANLSFETLSAMREASTSGGALGAINTRELQLLGATIDSLDIGLSDKVLKRNLNNIKEGMKAWQIRVQKERVALGERIQRQTPQDGRRAPGLQPVPDFSKMTDEELLRGF